MKILTWLLPCLLVSPMAQASVEEFSRVVYEHQEIIVKATPTNPTLKEYELKRENFHRTLADYTQKEAFIAIMKAAQAPTVTDTWFMSMTLRNSCLDVARTDAFLTDLEVRHQLIVLCGNTQFVNEELERSIRIRFNWSMERATKKDLYWMNALKKGLDASWDLYPEIAVLRDKLDKIALY